MGTPDTKAAIRAVGLAVWSWVAFAFVLSWATVQRDPARLLIGSGASEATVRRVRTDLGLEASLFDAFIATVTFDFGNSYVFAPGTSAWDFVADPAVTTFTLLGLAIVVAVGLVALGSMLGRRDARIPRALGFVGAVPTVGWWLGLFLLVERDVVGLPGPPFSTAELLVPASMLAVPIAAVGWRSRASRDDSVTAACLALFQPAGWLWLGWLVGTTLVVERVFGVSGLGSLVTEAFTTGDVPILHAGLAALSVPLLLGSCLRELYWEGSQGSSAPAPDDGVGRGVETDGGTTTERSALVEQVTAVVRESRQVRLGGATFGAALVLGLVALVALSPADSSTAGPSIGAVVVDLGAVTVLTVGALLFGTCIGIALAIASRRTAGGRLGGHLLVDTAVNVPMLVLVLVALLGVGQLPSDSSVTVGATFVMVAGLAVAAVCYRVLEHGRHHHAPGDGELSPVALLDAMVASGAAVAFIAADVVFLGLLGPDIGNSLTLVGGAGPALLAALVVVSFPVVSLLVVHDGLRRDVPTHSQ
ncbi:hypothetical protein [Haloarchaeobius sp. DFWS5]|uniref:hypothetical protein n=1 Tax=Haloarchaeobius sp. DFWS5 TaxID=3446114 RepID=UPI003EB97283